jgi:MoxR-like ATPase
MRMAQSVAGLRGERFVTPEHVQRLAEPVLAHRIVVKARSRVQGIDGPRIVAESVARVDVPIDYGPA